MAIGSQLIAREGLLGLEKGLVYYLLSNYGRDPVTRMITFLGQGAAARAYFVSIPRRAFEEALQRGDIEGAAVQHRLPPWLWESEEAILGSDVEAIAPWNEFHRQTIAHRLEAIRSLLESDRDLLGATNPMAAISRCLKKLDSKGNVTRIAKWYFAFILHGRDSKALLPETFRCGRWPRTTGRHAGRKFGRPSSRRGRKHGYAVTEDLAGAIVAAFLRHARECKSWTQIYVKAMERDFRCTVGTDVATKKLVFIQPEGQPFPTLEQFKYCVRKRFDQEAIDRIKYGSHYVHNRLKADEGSYSEAVANLMERVEFDGYYVKELPRSIDGDGSMPPLCVIRAVCVRTKAIVGVGISFWKERESAYRDCLFSMAVSKKEFCALFGLEISESKWPCIGLPGMLIIDRGPGMAILKDIQKLELSVINVTPTGKGQAKASVETHHPKRLRKIEGHEFIQSDLNYFQLVKQELNRALIDNHTANVRHLFTFEMISKVSGFSPMDLWNYLEKNYRNDAEQISFETAVRRLLKPKTVMIKQDGIHHHKLKYTSAVLKQAGFFDTIARGAPAETTAYVLEACLRRIWVDVNGRLHAVDVVPPTRDATSLLRMSHPDAERFNELASEISPDSEEHKLAYRLMRAKSFREDTGKEYDNSQIRKGRAKPAKSARDELREIGKYSGRGVEK